MSRSAGSSPGDYGERPSNRLSAWPYHSQYTITGFQRGCSLTYSNTKVPPVKFAPLPRSERRSFQKFE
jgi:hypothetical protein